MLEFDVYRNRVPSQNRNKEKFIATLQAVLDPVLSLQKLLASIPELYDLDRATGNQLDVVGEWVGRSRFISIPIEGVFFSFDDTEITGYDRGVWCGEYDATSGMTRLDDDSYRFLLKLQILANMWDGTPEKFYSGVRALFNDLSVVIEDHQNMTIAIGVVGKTLSSAQRALFLQQIAPFKPCGVRIDVFMLPQLDNTPLFAFDIDTDNLAGFDKGGWAEIINN